MITHSFIELFHFDALAITMILLVGFIGTIVTIFASNYMQGDSQYKPFFWRLIPLIVTVMTMVSTDHLFILLTAWGASNLLLIRLMIHKPQWNAARNAGILTAKTLFIGFTCLGCAFIILYTQTNETSIQKILAQIQPENHYILIATLLILLSAVTQSAIWPFHHWLLSSLNSPTPVSAIMHAGLVNGGGFLLARFAPLYLTESYLLTVIFTLGCITALIGTLWKLIQSDIKRMLACSTMGQMGFMFMQCGLGLFPAAVAHLCWHGMFKANYFLASNSALREKRIQIKTPIYTHQLIMALTIGMLSSYLFASGMGSAWITNDTRLFLIGLTFITASQFSLSMLIHSSWRAAPMIALLTGLLAYSYGISVFTMEWFFRNMAIYQPQPLNTVHVIAFALFFSAWLLIQFRTTLTSYIKTSHLVKMLYMRSVNSSQPHPSTVTSHRADYQYK